jgi:hypothetical protein
VIEHQVRKLERIVAGAESSPHLSIPPLAIASAPGMVSSPSQVSTPPPQVWWNNRRTATVAAAFLFVLFLSASWAFWRSSGKTSPQTKGEPTVDPMPLPAATSPTTSTGAPTVESPPPPRTAKPRAAESPFPPVAPTSPVSAWGTSKRLTIEPTAPRGQNPPPHMQPPPSTSTEDDPLGDRK